MLQTVNYLSKGPFINYVTLKAGGGSSFSVTFCDRQGEGSGRCVYTHGQKIISTVLLSLVIYLMGLVVWFWFFIGRLSRFCWLFSIFCHSFIHSFIICS